MDRPRVLLSTYGCDPARGSEPGVGFRWIELYLACGFDVTAIVHRDRRGGVERTLARLGREHAAGRFELVAIEPSRWQRMLNQCPGMWWLFYRSYQRVALRVVRERASSVHRVLFAHHITLNGFREPGYLWRLGLPFVWGPIGGVQDAAAVFTRRQGAGPRAFETARRALNRLTAAHGRHPRAARAAARLIFAANREAELWARVGGAARVAMLLETAVESLAEALPEVAERDGVLWVGSDERRKNPEFALAAHHLLRRFVARARLTLVGLGERRVAALRAWAMSRGIALDGVEFVGWTERDALAGLFSRARILWFSSYRDTSGNVVLEAMRHGVPVVAFDHQGAAVMLDEGAGQLVRVEGHAAMLRRWVARTLPLLTDDHAWDDASRRARRRIEERYLWTDKRRALLAELGASGLLPD